MWKMRFLSALKLAFSYYPYKTRKASYISFKNNYDLNKKDGKERKKINIPEIGLILLPEALFLERQMLV